MKKETIQELQKRKEELEFIKEKAYSVWVNAQNQVREAEKELHGINNILECYNETN